MVIKTKAQWDKLEKPLIEIDEKLSSISQAKGIVITKNHQNWPNRSLTLTSNDGLNRRLEVALDNKMQSFEIFGYVWFDDPKGRRFANILHLKKNIRPPLISIIENEISSGFDTLEKITKADLTLVK